MKPAAVGDFLVRHAVVDTVGRRKVRGRETECCVVLTLDGGNALHIGLKSEADAVKLRDGLTKLLPKR